MDDVQGISLKKKKKNNEKVVSITSNLQTNRRLKLTVKQWA